MRKCVMSVRNLSFSTDADDILCNISFDLFQGEVFGIVGINGVGKTLLAKLICGLERPDSGTVTLNGEALPEANPRGVHASGIGYIRETPEVLPNLTVAENLFLGFNERTGIFASRRRLYRSAAAVFREYRFKLDPAARARELNGAQRAQLQLARNLLKNPAAIVLDDLTCSFSESEMENLRRIIAGYTASGGAMICISHNYTDILSMADRLIVLRDNSVVLELEGGEIDRRLIGQVMYNVDSLHRAGPAGPAEAAAPAKEAVLELRHWPLGEARDFSLTLYRGEVLGLIGLNGSDGGELIRGLNGVPPVPGGEIWVEGRRVAIESPRDAIESGIATCFECREEMLFSDSDSVMKNVSSGVLGRISKGPFIRPRLERAMVEKFCTELELHGDIRRPIEQLNNASLLKVTLAKCMAMLPKILLLDEPNRELDLNGIRNLCQMIEKMRKGTSILLVLSKIDDMAQLCDRMLVLQNGRAIATLERGNLDRERLMELILAKEVSDRAQHDYCRR